MVGIPPGHKEKLIKNLTLLVTNLVVDDTLLTIFRQKLRLSEHWKEEIDQISRDNAKASKVLTEVEGSARKDAFEVLIEAMVRTSQFKLAEKVDPILAKKYKDIREREEPKDTVDEIPPGPVHSEDDRAILNDIDTLMPENIRVEKPKYPAAGNEPGSYQVRTDPNKRRAIVINNTCFTERLKEREGADVDGKNLEKLLNQLDFKFTKVFENLSVTKIIQTLSEECRIANDESVDILMVFILSHGCRGAVYGMDSEPIQINPTILNIIHSDQFPNLRGKPKLIFIQACRNEALPDVAVNESSTEQASDGAVAAVASRDEPDQLDSRIFPDTMLAFSTCSNFLSWRCPERGSWFIRAIVCVFARNTYKTHVSSMMTTVCRIVSRPRENNNYTQVPENNHTLQKNCYLFPRS